MPFISMSNHSAIPGMEAMLNSLVKIDNRKRPPCGSLYARKGAIVNIIVEGNNSKAKVKSSRTKPY